MCVESKDGRTVRSFVAARPLEHAATVVDDVSADVDLGIGPVDQCPVHPYLARTEAHPEFSMKTCAMSNLRQS